MLLGDLYRIIESGNNGQSLSATIEFNKDHALFKGHFPELPVVPGVCQMQMLGEIINQILDKNLQLAQASHIKFLALLNPTVHNQLLVDIKLSNDEDMLKVNANYSWADTTFFRFKGEFQ